jgi:hypothetical protein
LAWFLTSKRGHGNTQKPKIQHMIGWALFFSVLLLVVLIGSPGAIYLLKKSYAGLPRINVFFGAWLTSINLLTITASRGAQSRAAAILKFAGKTAIVSLAWLLVIFSFTYGQASNAQLDFEQGQISRIVGAISQLRATADDPGKLEVSVVGEISASKALLNATQKFPLLGKLIPRLIVTHEQAGIRKMEWYGLTAATRERTLAPTQSGSRIQTGKSPKDSALVTQPLLSQKECQRTPSSFCSSEFQVQLQDNKAIVFFPEQ